MRTGAPTSLAGLALAALCLLGSFSSLASFVDPAAARFQRLDATGGLSQSSVLATAQDSEGRIWVGTLNGLNRFDGHDNVVFRPRGGQDGEVADNFITSLLPGSDGRMWVGTLEGISRWEPDEGRFHTYRSDPEQPDGLRSNLTLALHRDAAGRLWAGTEQGLALWDPKADRFRSWPPGPEPTAGLPDPRITGITSHGDTLWVGTNAGPARFAIDASAIVPIEGFPHPGAPVTAIVADRLGRLFVGLDKRGVVAGSSQGDGWHELPVGDGPRQLGSSLVRAVYVDSHDQLWVGTEDGLDGLRLDAGEIVESVRYRSSRLSSTGLGGGVVAAIMEDREGTLWVGSWNQGINWLSEANNRFASFTAETPATLGFRNPSSIGLAAQGGVLWIGSGSGLYGFDVAERRLWEVSPGTDQQTYYCGLVHHGVLWFGHTRGLRVLIPDSGEFSDMSLPGKLAQGRLRRMLPVAGQVWVAVDPIGIALLDNRLEKIHHLQEIQRSVTFIQSYDERFVLVGAYDGLYWFDAQSGELRFRHELGAPASAGQAERLPLAPMDFVRTVDGRAWLATNGSGLAELVLPGDDPAEASFRFLDEGDGLIDGALKAMRTDARGRLWMSSASGISMFDPQSKRFENFFRGDGTLGRDYINAASTELEDGRLAFGGMDGFTLFDPEQVVGAWHGVPPVPLLSLLEADGRSYPLGRGLGSTGVAPPPALPRGGVRSLSLRFSATEYVDAGRITYRYRLQPIDADWTEVSGDRRIASYTGLDPGNYRFEVQASQDRMQWSESRELSMRIPPYWWQSLWARFGLLALVIGILITVHRLRMAGIARRNQWLSAEVSQRTRELDQRSRALEQSKNDAERALQRLEATQQELLRSEKMAALGQLVAGVAHEVNTPLGVALTASSVLREASARLSTQVEAGQVRRSDFDRFLGTVAESTGMVERNLERAAQLIANFKQVSVDRTSDGRRQFDLASYLEEVLESLRLMWKRRPIGMEVDCPDGVLLDSFPGAIGQVITNLTQNAVFHAFADESEGHMRIVCRRLGKNQVEIRLSDNGIGMPEEVRCQVFDPFFTTRRSEGGTGLGLHIVFNLVTQKLGGSIRVQSEPGQGSEFIMVLPCRAPS